jgi:putative (di)nucleoside polyphosphate hydrolase
MKDCIDADGFRANVGIILTNATGSVFWAGRAGRPGWQFPQGGILPGESPREAMFRELEEEIGLTREDVSVLGTTRGWLRYRLPSVTSAGTAARCASARSSAGSCCAW